jgi:hypothetical protein
MAVKNQVLINNCTFSQNLAGNGPSAISIKSVQKSFIQNSSFVNNTGAFSFLEKEYALPFYEILTMRSNHLNFISLVGSKDKC